MWHISVSRLSVSQGLSHVPGGGEVGSGFNIPIKTSHGVLVFPLFAPHCECDGGSLVTPRARCLLYLS